MGVVNGTYLGLNALDQLDAQSRARNLAAIQQGAMAGVDQANAVDRLKVQGQINAEAKAAENERIDAQNAVNSIFASLKQDYDLIGPELFNEQWDDNAGGKIANPYAEKANSQLAALKAAYQRLNPNGTDADIIAAFGGVPNEKQLLFYGENLKGLIDKQKREAGVVTTPAPATTQVSAPAVQQASMGGVLEQGAPLSGASLPPATPKLVIMERPPKNDGDPVLGEYKPIAWPQKNDGDPARVTPTSLPGKALVPENSLDWIKNGSPFTPERGFSAVKTMKVAGKEIPAPETRDAAFEAAMLLAKDAYNLDYLKNGSALPSKPGFASGTKPGAQADAVAALNKQIADLEKQAEKTDGDGQRAAIEKRIAVLKDKIKRLGGQE